MKTAAEFLAAVIAPPRPDGAQTMAPGCRACDLQVQLARQLTAPVKLDRGLGGGDETATAPTGTVGANFSILA